MSAHQTHAQTVQVGRTSLTIAAWQIHSSLRGEIPPSLSIDNGNTGDAVRFSINGITVDQARLLAEAISNAADAAERTPIGVTA